MTGWCCFHYTIFSCLFYALTYNPRSRLCMTRIKGDGEDDGAWYQGVSGEACQGLSYIQGSKRSDYLHIGMLIIVNQSGFMIHFLVLSINSYGPWRWGLSCPINERFLVWDEGVACNSRHLFTSKHGILSTFNTQEVIFSSDLWLLVNIGAMEG